MSAYEKLRVTITCDWQGCDAKHVSEDHTTRSTTWQRKLLGAAGWRHVRRRPGFLYNPKDFCPKHNALSIADPEGAGVTA